MTAITLRIPDAMDQPLRDAAADAPSLNDYILRAVRRQMTLDAGRKLALVAPLDLDGEGVPFHVKKEITSAMRRLARCRRLQSAAVAEPRHRGRYLNWEVRLLSLRRDATFPCGRGGIPGETHISNRTSSHRLRMQGGTTHT